MKYDKILNILYYLFLISAILTIISPLITGFSESTNKSPLSPPQWIFYPMWTILFFLIALSLKTLRDKKISDKKLKIPVILFITQLVFNFLWGVIYGLGEPLLALISLIFAWFFVLFSLTEFRELSKKSGYYLLPYLAWMTIAVIVSTSSIIYS